MYQVWGCPAVTFACVLRVYKSQNLRALRGIFFFRSCNSCHCNVPTLLSLGGPSPLYRKESGVASHVQRKDNIFL